MKKQNKNHQKHVPVMLQEILSILDPQEGQSYLDLTAGYAGHATDVIRLTRAPERATLVDRDTGAIAYLKQKFGKPGPVIIHDNFHSASSRLSEQGRQFDLILADLGVSSPHLEDASRGFSITRHGPLDMRMDQTQVLKAEDLVNSLSQKELVTMLSDYGEEPKARAIAAKIVKNRPISSTTQLADIVKSIWPGHSRIHPATRTFQALRIAANDELNQLNDSLPIWENLLKSEGRIAIITFHSLEDRIVKQFFQERAGNTYDATLDLLTKKPLTPSKNEIDLNPRARSAKLRAVAKINTNTERNKRKLHANSG